MHQTNTNSLTPFGKAFDTQLNEACHTKLNRVVANDLAKISASWSKVEIKRASVNPDEICSRTKW